MATATHSIPPAFTGLKTGADLARAAKAAAAPSGANTLPAATTGKTARAASTSDTQSAGSASGSTASGAAETGTKATLSSDFTTFLQMLTVQMENQDPLNPIDSSDYAVQLATFSSVEQQVVTNDLLEGLAAQMGAMGMAQLAGWVGMDARSSAAGYFDGTPVSLSPSPERLADAATLVVRDASNTIVQRVDVPVSSDTIEWAGVGEDGAPFAAGAYSFELESYANGDLLGTSAVETYTRITEARNDNGTTVLLLEGGAQIAASGITALRQGN